MLRMMVHRAVAVDAGGSGDGGFSFGSPAGAAANGAVSAAGNRKALYSGILSKLRALMVNRMAKPEVRLHCRRLGCSS
jgi:hypothetical protein